MNSFQGEVVLSTLVLWEFRQAARFQVFRHHQDRTQGYSKTQADKLFAALDSNLADKAFMISKVEWSDVHSRAEGLSAQYTIKGGHRPMDILHLSTSMHLGLPSFLTLDTNQKKLATATGLKVPL